jgi:hypothetical protein
MTVPVECVEAAAVLGGEAAASHVASCASCRATAATLSLVRRASRAESPDLWRRLRVRLADDTARVELRFPVLGWPAAAAAAIFVAAASLAPEPGRLLTVILGMV